MPFTGLITTDLNVQTTVYRPQSKYAGERGTEDKYCFGPLTFTTRDAGTSDAGIAKLLVNTLQG